MKKTLLAATAALAIAAAMPLSGCGCVSARVAGSAVEAAGSAEMEKNATADEHAADDEGSAVKAETTEADEGDKKDPGKTDEAKADDSGGKADSKKNDSKGGAASQASGGTSGSSASGPSPAQPQKKWVPEQGHWETDYGQVWVPNVVYVRHGRFICNACGATFDSKNGFYAHSDAMYAQGQNHDGYTDDSYTTSEDQGHYEQQATGRHWVVDVAGHWE